MYCFILSPTPCLRPPTLPPTHRWDVKLFKGRHFNCLIYISSPKQDAGQTRSFDEYLRTSSGYQAFYEGSTLTSGFILRSVWDDNVSLSLKLLREVPGWKLTPAHFLPGRK